MLVQEQSGNATYDISGFKTIIIHDDLEDVRDIYQDYEKSLFSIRVYFTHETKEGDSFIVLGRYEAYGDAQWYYSMLVGKIASGNSFVSMVPDNDREPMDRAD